MTGAPRVATITRAVLTIAAVMVAGYSLLATMTLLDGRPIAVFEGSGVSFVRALAGVAAFGLALAAAAFIYGLLRKRDWARREGLAVFALAAGALLASGLAGVSSVALLIPIAICATAMWTLISPEMRSELDAPKKPSVSAAVARPMGSDHPGVAPKSTG